MKHDTFKPGVWAEVNTEGSRNDIAVLIIDWKCKQYQEAGR